jgi:hypothetical protein
MMDDGGWTLGLLTLAAICGGAAVYAKVALNYIFKEPWPELPKDEAPKPDYRAALQKQALDAETRLQRWRESDGITEAEWVGYAADRLRESWPEVDYDEACRLLREYLADCHIAFGDDSDFWTRTSAREFAEGYMSEVGESMGND